MAFTQITVTRSYRTAFGAAAVGTVTFAPTVPLRNGTTIIAAPVTGTLNPAGDLSVVLAANDDAATTPPRTSYLVAERLAGQRERTYYVIIPSAAPGGTVDLASLVAAESPPAVVYPAAGPIGPAGPAGSPEQGFRTASTGAGGNDTFDSTKRIAIPSYQTNGANFFGEGLRLDLMGPQAKDMIAWRMARPASAPSPVEADMRSVVWIGAHYAAQDNPADIHGHWSIEIPDAADALRTRFEVSFIDPTSGLIGRDHTNIKTNATDFTVRSAGILRLAGLPADEKTIEWSSSGTGDELTAKRRWHLYQTNQAESGAGQGSNLRIRYYDDPGTTAITILHVQRSNGNVTIGSGTDAGARLGVVYSGAGNAAGVLVAPTSALASAGAFSGSMFAVTDRFLNGLVQGDTVSRVVVFADGKTEWGPGGAAGRDTNLYRSAADTLKTDDAFHVGTVLRHLGTTAGFFGAAAVARPAVGAAATDAATTQTLANAMRTALINLGLVTA